MAGTISPTIPTIGQPNSTEDVDIKTSLETLRDALNAILNSSNKVDPSLFLEADRPKLKWYTPKNIATEESRENTAFGTLTTADEIKEVVIPENGLIMIGYLAKWKTSSVGTGRAAIFLGANQLKIAGTNEAVVQETTNAAGISTLSAASIGLLSSVGEGTFITTGQILANSLTGYGGMLFAFAAAGTYNISIKYKATSGSVTAKERKLWIAVLG